MVLTADDVGDAKVDVVDHARQQIEPAAVLAAHDGVGQQAGIEPLLAADEVVPFDRRSWSSLKRQCGARPSGTGEFSGLRS